MSTGSDCTTRVIYSGRTVTSRHLTVSRPIRLGIRDKIVTRQRSVFDYGCGTGSDIRWLCERGYGASGWDPNHCPSAPLVESDVVNLAYVLNVIADPIERTGALINAYSLCKSILIIAVRRGQLSRNCEPYRDGYYIKHRKTFQKIYQQEELIDYISSSLKITLDHIRTVEQGIVYIFRDTRPHR